MSPSSAIWSETELKAVLEAALLASREPLSLTRIQELFDLDQRPDLGTLARTLEALRVDCVDRGIEPVEVASGWRFQVKPLWHRIVGRLQAERPARYTRATLETLALIAYRQPITRGEIEAVRGVAVSSQILKNLEERDFIRVLGHKEVPGRPALYGTTRAFLDHFQLKSLADLPTLAELRDLDTVPQLPFPDVTAPMAPIASAGPRMPVDAAASPPTSAADVADASPPPPAAETECPR